ncbi:MAG: VWA domain-containing protein [Bacteroidales bacterium]
MNTNMQMHNLIILDESGSMEEIRDFIIKGFNEIVQTLKGMEKQFPEQEHFVSFITFNGLRINVIHFMEPVRSLNELNTASYLPNSSTPLFDAMGVGLNMMRKALAGQDNYDVSVTILTDGMENSSKEYTATAINRLVEELKKGNWSFKYIGADHDVQRAAELLSIDVIKNFKENPKIFRSLFSIESSDIFQYYSNLHKKNAKKSSSN